MEESLPEVDNRDLELLLTSLLGVVGAKRGTTALVDGELLLLGGDLEEEVRDALVEMLLGSPSDDEGFASLLVIRRLDACGRHQRVLPRDKKNNGSVAYELVDAFLVGLALELLPHRDLTTRIRLLRELLLEVRPKQTRSASKHEGNRGKLSKSRSRLTLQPPDLVLEPPSSLGSSAFELVLHSLEVAHQVGEMRSFLAEGGVFVDQARLDALQAKSLSAAATAVGWVRRLSRTFQTSRSERRFVFSWRSWSLELRSSVSSSDV